MAKICEICGLDFNLSDTYPQITAYLVVKIHNILKFTPHPLGFSRFRFNKVYKLQQTPPRIPFILYSPFFRGNIPHSSVTLCTNLTDFHSFGSRCH